MSTMMVVYDRLIQLPDWQKTAATILAENIAAYLVEKNYDGFYKMMEVRHERNAIYPNECHPSITEAALLTIVKLLAEEADKARGV